MKILSAQQTREADLYTIENEPISSIDLMERAVSKLVDHIKDQFDSNTSFKIFCGKGNNGGDGLALARRLSELKFRIEVYVVDYSDKASQDFKVNYDRLLKRGIEPIHIQENFNLAIEDKSMVLIDALFGSGLNRPLEAWLKKLIKDLNALPNYKIAIDIPSGLFADDNSENDFEAILKADLTLSFQYPKRSFFHKMSRSYVGDFKVLDIQLDSRFMNSANSRHYHFEHKDAKELYQPRRSDSYKGSYGHALLIAGSGDKMGAALLSAESCLRGGAGLLTLSTVKSGQLALNTRLPEAMLHISSEGPEIENLADISKYKAIGIGPGIGTSETATSLLKRLISESSRPLVLDADALNILADNKTWLAFLPKGSILTPHIGEFRRLLGREDLGSDYEEQLRDFSVKNGLVTILKDSVTTVAGAAGNLFYLNNGSPALATAGSGDVLTGLVLALLSNSYSSIDAALLGAYIHAQSGSLAGEENSLETVLASDLPHYFSKVYQSLQP